MDLMRDSKNHLYTEVGNLRVTYIPAHDRSPDTDWAGADVLRVQAYKDGADNSLHMGAEIPISSYAEFGQFVAALCQIYMEGRS